MTESFSAIPDKWPKRLSDKKNRFGSARLCPQKHVESQVCSALASQRRWRLVRVKLMFVGRYAIHSFAV